MAEPIVLRASSGDAQIDQITAGVITIFEAHFPDRVCGYFFAGSCADGALTPLSDIDLVVVFANPQTPPEQEQLHVLHRACKQISPRSLDVSSTDVPLLQHADQLRFQPDWGPVLTTITLAYASCPVYGIDIRAMIPEVPHDVYARTIMHFPYLVLAGQRKHPAQLPYPLPYLDPEDAFYGYTGRLLRAANGELTASTKRIVHASGYIATALVALQTTAYVGDKRSAVTAYRRYINDEWADHLEAVQQYCRVQWGYRVPTGAADRQILREIGQRELAFENYFLQRYKEYLHQEQDGDDPGAREFARERIQGIA